MEKIMPYVRGVALIAAVTALTACAVETDDLTNSRLSQPPAGSPPMVPLEGGDIAIAGQQAAHAIMDLPEVANAAVPPLVQFTGVTSIVTSPVPIDTEPYTTLLRDRLLLVAREKLRFIERELPQLLVSSKKGKKKKQAEAQPAVNDSNPDYRILAELHGRYENDYYNVQIEFVDTHTGDVLFNGLYRIAKEATNAPPPSGDTAPPPAQDASQAAATGAPE